jgi:AraC family transcriptional regulator
MQETSAAVSHCRLVSGQVVSSIVAEAANVRVEILGRRTGGRISWQFRQPKLALFWYRRGFARFRLEIGGRPVSSGLSPKISLGLFPAEVEVAGEFEGSDQCEYAVVFLAPAFIVAHCGLDFKRPLAAFGHEHLKRGLAGLCREAMAPDNLFDLFAEGWAMQALAQLSRAERSEGAPSAEWRGGLPPASLRRVEDYIRANLSAAINLADLADIAGLSRRHFLRAFRASVGQTPLRHVRDLRIEEAKHHLSDVRQSITDVALECGFSHAQHFATSFRTATGVTPSAFRHQRLS